MSQGPGVYKGKVVFVGDAGVGKTSLINAYRGLVEPVSPTVAAHSVTLTISHDRGTTSITVFDTAGQDDYRCLVPLYARGAEVAVIVYSEDSLSSFDHLPDWIDYLSSSSRIPHTLLVGNKSDLPPGVPFERSDAFAEDRGMTLIRTSAVTRQNVDILFAEIAGLVDRRGAVDTAAVTLGGEKTPIKRECCHM
jgi:small GTP-binding protein